MIRLDAATVLLQWSTGSLLFLWVTTRHRLVGIGYGWLLRLVFGIMALGSVVAAHFTKTVPVREASAVGVVLCCAVAFVVSYVRRVSGVGQQRAEIERKQARVAAMSGPTSASFADGDGPATATMAMRDQFGRASSTGNPALVDGPEFPPALDLLAPACGMVGLIAGGIAAGGNVTLAIARTVVGALFLGAVSDAMLLGHWYLVQPGLSRRPIGELNTWLMRIWPVEVGLLLVPTGMVSVLNGSISDHYNGMLGWFWVACALTTLALTFVTRAALKERFYSAVMAATGLLYLAILTAFGTDLVARALLAG